MTLSPTRHLSDDLTSTMIQRYSIISDREIWVLFPYVGISISISAGNRGNFAARLLGKIAERLIDYNRLFGSSPDTQ